MNNFSWKKFCILLNGSLLVFGLQWFIFLHMNLHPYYIELTEDSEVLKAEGPVISGEISADDSEIADFHKLSIVEQEKQNVELYLLISITFLSLFIISLLQLVFYRGNNENAKTYKRLKQGTMGVLFSFLMAVLQYVMAGSALNNVFS